MENDPFLLPASALLRFAPATTFFGTPGALGVRLLDSSNKSLITSARQLSSPLSTGGSAAASAEIVNLVLIVAAAPSSLTLSSDSLVASSDSSGSAIGQLLANDPDTRQIELLYSKNGINDDNNLVEISNAGEIFLSSSISKEQLEIIRDRGFLTINVQVKDDTNNTRISTLKIAAESAANKAPNVGISEINFNLLDPPMDQGTSAEEKIIFRTIDELFGQGSGVFSDIINPDNLFGTFNGIAIVANAASTDPLNGRWQFRSSGGTWTNLPIVSEGTPLILSPTCELRFKASSSFSGSPGALSVRVLDNSKSYAEGLLSSASLLISGSSGAASAEIVKLQTYITPKPAQGPEKIFFSTERNILIEADGSVVPGTLLGTFAAIDPDTKPQDLLFKNLTLFGTFDPGLAQKLVITNGNELRSAEIINAQDLKSISFSITAQDDTLKELDSLSLGTTFKLKESAFSTQEDTTIRSETSVLPGTGNSDQAILFSATGLGGELTVTVGPTLTSNDLAGVTSTDLGQESTAGKVESITPIAPLLEFTLALDTPGSVARFEFELPANLSWTDLLKIQYLKLLADGTLSVFEYRPDDFNVFTGARLEITGNIELTSSDQLTYGGPVYLAVYIQDNARGDDDLTIGSIRDPGAPIFLSVAASPSGEGGGATGGTSSSGGTSSGTSSGGTSSGSSGGNTPTSTTSLGIFEVANSDEVTPSATRAEASNSQGTGTLAAVTSEVQSITVTDDSTSGEGQNQQLVKGLKRSSQDDLRTWAKRLGLLQASGGLKLLENIGNNQMNKSAPLDFINKKLGIDPERSSELLNALLFGGASIYIINKTSPGLLRQWAEAIWSNQTKRASTMNRANKVIAIFLIRSTESLDRLVAAELHDDAIEILAEEKLLFSLDTAAQRHQASFDTQLKKLCLKLENIGLTTNELLLLDPEIKAELATVEHLGRETKFMEPDRLRSVVQELTSTELDQLQAWLAKPSSNPLGGHPIRANLQKRQIELGRQLSPEKANVASLIELSLAIGLRQPTFSLV